VSALLFDYHNPGPDQTNGIVHHSAFTVQPRPALRVPDVSAVRAHSLNGRPGHAGGARFFRRALVRGGASLYVYSLSLPAPLLARRDRPGGPQGGRQRARKTMSIDKSLRRKNQLARARNVLTRAERIKVLQDEERWKDGRSPFGLPKVRVLKVVIKKVKKVKEEEKPGEVPAAEPAAKPAAKSGKK